MTEQEKREKVIKELECCVSLNHNGSKCANCDYADEFNNGDCETYLLSDALALLKEHEKATVEPKRIDLTDETKAWLDKMDAVDALGNIVNICMDWDGYRTADGLGGLINEVWSYARSCADRLAKAQEAQATTPEAEWLLFKGKRGATCSYCRHTFNDVYDVENYDYYCRHCGAKMIRMRTVKWE